MPMEHAGYQRISANQHTGYAYDMGQGGCQSINHPYLCPLHQYPVSYTVVLLRTLL